VLDLTLQKHEFVVEKQNNKSLPNIALADTEYETKTKNTGVSNTFEIVEQNKIFRASCPNLTLKHEWTVEKLNFVKKISHYCQIWH